ncbi:hypothetical protein [Micromonospora sonchi]|nr:hypothetical protein [Micromonospora sonchi]
MAADVYRLTARLATKLHEHGVAWAAVDRATRAAHQSGCSRAVAQVARAATVVLRRSGDGDHAQRVIVDAAHRLRTDTKLADGRDASLYAEMLATAAYTAAAGDRRDEAWTCAGEAGAALAAAPPGPGFGVNELELFRSGIARLLGDFGQAVDHAGRVRVDLLPTTERRARFWQDAALAWWGRGRRREAWEALREAERVAPQEVRYRPWARDLASGLLSTPGPQLSGLREFAARTGLG